MSDKMESVLSTGKAEAEEGSEDCFYILDHQNPALL